MPFKLINLLKYETFGFLDGNKFIMIKKYNLLIKICKFHKVFSYWIKDRLVVQAKHIFDRIVTIMSFNIASTVYQKWKWAGDYSYGNKIKLKCS